jgi:Alr-MurF fusion protein
VVNKAVFIELPQLVYNGPMLHLADLLALGGRLHGTPHAEQFRDCSYDSRLTRPGELFIALRTARADGHQYIPDALVAGATGLLCAVPPPDPGLATVIVADDPLSLLQHWAAWRLQRVAPTLVAVTGSVGKTLTRRAITTLLSKQGPTFESRDSFNTALGLPVALARMEDGVRYAVLEYASDFPGEIAGLAALFPPKVAVITNVAEVHTRAFALGVADPLAHLAREFMALVEHLPADGVAVLNGDDPWLMARAEGLPVEVVTFGQGKRCTLRAVTATFTADGIAAEVSWRGHWCKVFSPLLGEPGLYATLAALATALACGGELARCAAAFAELVSPPGRLRPLPGPAGALLIDDSADASLPAALAALRSLGALPARRRIAIVGDLAGVSADPVRAYRQLGELAGATLDLLVARGDGPAQALASAQSIQPALPIFGVHTTSATVEALPADLGVGDIVLLTGGASARLERVVERLISPEAPFKGEGLPLVRQETAWRSVRIGLPGRPTWLRIDLDALAENIRRLRELAGVPLMVVLKADAYGHGAVRVARSALAAGAQWLAVATLGEAIVLREAGLSAPLLVLGYTPPWQAREAALRDVHCTVFDEDAARALAAAGTARNHPVPIHIKVDTGMARLGLPVDQAAQFVRWLHHLPGLQVEGLYTHFATADSADEGFARAQLGRFNTLLAELEGQGLRPPLVHAANSAALLRFPEARFDLVRPGIACYGLRPAPETPLPEGLRPVLSFHSEVAQVREHPAGTPISYGATFVTERPSRIATVPVGYGDGVRRSPPWHQLLVRGRRAPIVGRICMDYLMLDVTDIPGVQRGDAVVLLGSQGNETITADEAAEWIGTINYEVVTGILPRVPRESYEF